MRYDSGRPTSVIRLKISQTSRGRPHSCPSRIRCQAATGSWTKSPAVGDLTDIVQLGTGYHVSAGEGQPACWPFNDASLRTSLEEARRHATLPRSWIQRENWEFETHRRVVVPTARCFSRDSYAGSVTTRSMDSEGSPLSHSTASRFETLKTGCSHFSTVQSGVSCTQAFLGSLSLQPLRLQSPAPL